MKKQNFFYLNDSTFLFICPSSVHVMKSIQNIIKLSFVRFISTTLLISIAFLHDLLQSHFVLYILLIWYI